MQTMHVKDSMLRYADIALLLQVPCAAAVSFSESWDICLPAVLDAPLSEDDGDWDVGAQGDEHDDCNPGLQRGGDEDARRHDVE